MFIGTTFDQNSGSRVKSSVIKPLLQYGIGIGLLAYLIYFSWDSKPGKPTDVEKGLSLIAGASVDVHAQITRTSPGVGEILRKPIRYELLALATILWSVALIITFLRWHLLVVAQGLVFSRYDAIRLGLMSYFFNTFLPGSVGGDIVKAYAVARDQDRRTVAVATVLLDRIIGLWALAWFVALSGGVFWAMDDPTILNNPALKTIIRATTLIVVGSAVVWSLMGLFSADKSEGVANWFSKIPKIGHSIGELWRACWMYRRKKKAVAIALLMTLAGHSGWVLIFHLCVNAFPDMDSASVTEHMLVVPVGMTAQALFPLPGGVGGGEAAYGWLYTLLGKAAAGGIIGCLAQRIVAWGIGLLGYLIYLRMNKTPQPATVTASAEAKAA
jgi:glycosyltransferase 2 family protein